MKIEVKSIDLTGLTLEDELKKRDEENAEFIEALNDYLETNDFITKQHLLEESCDVIQVIVSILKSIGITVEEFCTYWNEKHIEKMKDRPREKSIFRN